MTSHDTIKPSVETILTKFRDPSLKEAIQQANSETIKRMKLANPALVGIGKAKDHIPGMRENLFLHAGPPIDWRNASGALKGAIIGGLLFEGLAKNKDEAIEVVKKGEIELASCHDYGAVGPMAGIISHSMSVYIIEDLTSGSRFYSNLSDDLGDQLGSSVRFGVYDQRAIDHLNWLEDTVAPILRDSIDDVGRIDFVPIIGRSVLMGDDCHTTMNAATPLFLRELMPGLIRVCNDPEKIIEIVELIYNDSLFALNPFMATCKAISHAGSGIRHSSIVTVMARNGTEFGIKISGLGDRWFTGLAEIGQGTLSPGLTPSDVGRDMGDSAITETMGLGGTVKSNSGTAEDAINITKQMYTITHSESDVFRIPTLAGRGTPMGFDLFKIVEKNIRPFINSGLANRHMNRYSAGVGHLHPPMEAFIDAAIAFSEEEL